MFACCVSKSPDETYHFDEDSEASDDEVAKGKHMDGTAHGDAERKMRRGISEENYARRREFKMTYTVLVSHAECHARRVPTTRSASRVSFSTLPTCDALRHFAGNKRNRVCALNFANGSERHVGGGYKRGAKAQEEDLCRRIPNLFPSLLGARQKGLYPFGPGTYRSPAEPGTYSDVLFTPLLTLARKGEEDGYAFYPEGQRPWVALVSAAAPNCPRGECQDVSLLANTVRSIFVAPKLKQPDVNVLVLGAWGCGAFAGNPEQICDLFIDALKDEYLGRLYDEIHFAVPQFKKDDVNAGAFRAALTKQKVTFQELRS